MEDLSRAEVERLIGFKTEGVILGTAMLFLAAGSMWAHFALGPLFFEPPFVMCWLLIHVGSFLALYSPRFGKLMPLAGFLALQLHFYSSTHNYSLPYFPMAPLFFLVATLSLMTFRWARARSVITFWALSWASTVFWLDMIQGDNPQARTALFVCVGLNLFFVGSFLAMMNFFSKRMEKLFGSMGPHQRFDSQRIHASRLQALGELAGGLSHEIQNPLTSINGYSYQIQEDLREPHAETLSLVQKANERIKFNVDRIIDITKVMKGFVRDTSADAFTDVSVKAVVLDTVSLMKHNIKSSGVELQIQLPEDDARIHGNAVEISQVLVNLLSNARDACQESDRKRVTIGYGVVRGSVEIWVEDTGPGIDAKIKSRVFNSFFTTKPSGVGTGLGLYIAGIIAERHRGQLQFECPVDPTGRVLGTRFKLRLQLANAARQAQSA